MAINLKNSLLRSTLVNVLMAAAREARVSYCQEKQRSAMLEVRTQIVESYLQQHQVRKLQVGAGENFLPDWLNTDIDPVLENIAYLNVTEQFPFVDHTFDYIFSEHLIEHLSYKEGLFMLREMFRILKPGGKVRIATPNILKMIELYTPKKNEAQKKYLTWSSEEVIGLYDPQKTDLQKFFPAWDIDFQHMQRCFPDSSEDTVCFVVNNFVRTWGHQFIYDPYTLQRTLEGVGFVNVKQCVSGKSEDKHLRLIDAHANIIGEEMNQFETMIFEGTRPYATQK